MSIPTEMSEQIKLCVNDFFVIKEHYEKEKERVKKENDGLKVLKAGLDNSKEALLDVLKKYDMDKVVSRENNTTFIAKTVEKSTGGTLKDYKELVAKFLSADQIDAFNREIDSRKTVINKEVLNVRKTTATKKYERSFTTA